MWITLVGDYVRYLFIKLTCKVVRFSFGATVNVENLLVLHHFKMGERSFAIFNNMLGVGLGMKQTD